MLRRSVAVVLAMAASTISVSAQTCPNGAPQAACFANPCAVTTCPVNHACVPNYCNDFPSPNVKACSASCYPIATTCPLKLGQSAELRCGPGTAFQYCSDGCNTCGCANDKFTACTLMGCITSATCTTATGKQYMTGDMLAKSAVKAAADDTSNMCVCGPNGGWICSDITSATRPPSTGSTSNPGDSTSSPVQTKPAETRPPATGNGGGPIATLPPATGGASYVRITIAISFTQGATDWQTTLLAMIKRVLGLATDSSRVDISMVLCYPTSSSCAITVVIRPAENTLPACTTPAPVTAPSWAPIKPVDSTTTTTTTTTNRDGSVSSNANPPSNAAGSVPASSGSSSSSSSNSGSAGASTPGSVPSSGSGSGSGTGSSTGSSTGSNTGSGSSGNSGSGTATSTIGTGTSSGSTSSSSSSTAVRCINIGTIYYSNAEGGNDHSGDGAVPPSTSTTAGGGASNGSANSADTKQTASASASSLDSSALAEVLNAQANDGASPLRTSMPDVKSGQLTSSPSQNAATAAVMDSGVVAALLAAVLAFVYVL